MPNPLKLSTTSIAYICDTFKTKAMQADLKQGSKAYRTAHFDYFYGSIATLKALDLEPPAWWTLALMTGRDISDNGKPI